MATYPDSLPPTESISAVYSDNEDEEVDQLDSDFEDEIPVGGSTTRRARRRRSGERLPGQTILPAAKIESILQADGTGTPANHLSKEAMFMLSIATEEFIKKLSVAGHQQGMAERRTDISYNDLAAATQQYQEFMFLKDTIPQPLTVVDAFERRTSKEKAQLANDPAISSSSTYIPSFVTPSGLALTNAQKGKGKGKATTNGKPKANGSAGSGTAPKPRQRDKNGRYSNGDEEMDLEASPNGSSGGAKRTSRTSTSRPDGEPPAAESGVFSSHVPWHPIQHPSGTESSPPTEEGHWAPQQYLGPASGFLQDRSRLPFGTENPGRTIYSQR